MIQSVIIGFSVLFGYTGILNMFGGDHPNAREVFRARWQGCGNGSDKEIKFLKSSKLWLRQMGPSFDMFWPQGSCSFQQHLKISKHVYDSYISYKWKRLQKCGTSCASIEVDERAKQSVDSASRFLDKWSKLRVMKAGSISFLFCIMLFFLSFLCQGLNRWVLTWTISGNDLLPLWRSWRCTWKCMEVRWVMWVGNCMKLLGLLMRKPTKIHPLTTPSTPAIRPAISSQPDITISEFFARIVPSFAAKFLLWGKWAADACDSGCAKARQLEDSMCDFGFCSIYRQDNQKFETCECTKAMEKLRSSEV